MIEQSPKTRAPRRRWMELAIVLLTLVAGGMAARDLPAAATAGRAYIPLAIGRVSFAITPVGDGFDNVTGITHAGDERLFVSERAGVVKILHPDGRTTVFLDISTRVVSDGGEYGFYGIAFHPGYRDATSPGVGQFFAAYTTGTGVGPTREVKLVVSRFRASAAPDVADPASETIIFSEVQSTDVHKGGGMDFDPRDNRLYVGVGDDRLLMVAQSDSTPKGKIVRFAVDDIPPNITGDARAAVDYEIWAKGLRNPWRIDVDPASEQIFVGEVGYLTWEEVNLVPLAQPGLNFGWPCMEGPDLIPAAADDPECQNPQAFTRAVHEYAHQDGSGRCAIIGGHAHRPYYNPDDGRYIFADFCTREIFTLQQSNGTWERALLGIHDTNLITTIGEDALGFQYLGTVGAAGPIYRLYIP